MEYIWKHPTGIRDNIKPILIDKENKAVKVGDRVFDRYEDILSYDSLLQKCFTFRPSTYVRKNYNKEWSEFLGLPPIKYFKLFKGLMYEVFIKEDEQFICKHCFDGRRRPSPHKVNVFNTNKEWFTYLNNNHPNLIPVAIRCGKYWFDCNPGVIDKLKENSYNRNKVISENMRMSELGYDILNLPTSLIKTCGKYSHFSDFDKYVLYVTNNRLLTQSHKYTTMSSFRNMTQLGFDMVNVKINKKVKIKSTSFRGVPWDISNYFSDLHKPTRNELMMVRLTIGEDCYESMSELFAFANIEIT